MTENRSQIAKLLMGLATYYDVELSNQRLKLFVDVLEDLDPNQIGHAIRSIQRDPEIKFMPLPAVLREKVLGNAKDTAIEAVNKIPQAMKKFGYMRAKEAREFLGEVAWYVVERNGGWQPLCEATKESEIPIKRAQWRELAQSYVKNQQLGNTIANKQLKSPENKGKNEKSYLNRYGRKILDDKI